jgi:WD40 repeat protein
MAQLPREPARDVFRSANRPPNFPHFGIVVRMLPNPQLMTALAMKMITVFSVIVASLIFAGQLRAGREKTAAIDVGERVVSMALSGDGTLLVTGSWEGAVRLWDLRTGEQIRTFKGHVDMITAAALSSDSKKLVTASLDGTARLWDVASGKEKCVYPAGEKGQHCLAAIDSEAKWMVASVGPNPKLWDLNTGKAVRNFAGNVSCVCSLALSADGKWLVTGAAGEVDSTARLWYVATGKEIIRLQHLDTVTSVGISKNGQWLVTGSLDKTARLWEIASAGIAFQEPEQIITFRHDIAIGAAKLSNDGKWLVTTTWVDGVAHLWDAATGKHLRVFRGHTKGIYCAALSGDNRLLVTASEDLTVRLWDLASGKERLRPGQEKKK